jgi:phosphoenolpyruvate-protein kinase (PTS system EI component)
LLPFLAWLRPGSRIAKAVRAAEAASKNETLKVQAEACERARKMYESGIHQLEDQLERLRKQLSEEQIKRKSKEMYMHEIFTKLQGDRGARSRHRRHVSDETAHHHQRRAERRHRNNHWAVITGLVVWLAPKNK